MAIRRTREEKQHARLKREQVAYTFAPESLKPKPPVSKKSKQDAPDTARSPRPQRADSYPFLRSDLLRTAASLLVLLLLLIAAWYFLR